jgi:hypothetical protein
VGRHLEGVRRAGATRNHTPHPRKPKLQPRQLTIRTTRINPPPLPPPLPPPNYYSLHHYPTHSLTALSAESRHEAVIRVGAHSTAGVCPIYGLCRGQPCPAGAGARNKGLGRRNRQRCAPRMRRPCPPARRPRHHPDLPQAKTGSTSPGPSPAQKSDLVVVREKQVLVAERV